MTISEFARNKLGCGYLYGSSGEICTPKLRQEKAKQYPAQKRNIMEVSSRWDGMETFDCAQLTRLAAKAAGFTLPSGATSQWKCSGWAAKGEIGAETELLPDDILFRQDRKNKEKMAHVGIFAGGGAVIEAKGAAYGVVQTSFAEGNWTHWARLGQKAEEKQRIAHVTASSGSTVNMRDKPGGKVLRRLPLGTAVQIAEEWSKVRYCGQTGWIMTEFLEEKI